MIEKYIYLTHNHRGMTWILPQNILLVFFSLQVVETQFLSESFIHYLRKIPLFLQQQKKKLTLVTFAYPAVRLGMFGHNKLFWYNIIKIPFEILAF